MSLIRLELVIDTTRKAKFYAQWTCPRCNTTMGSVNVDDSGWHDDARAAIGYCMVNSGAHVGADNGCWDDAKDGAPQ